ncbi:S8 family peptidase [Leptolyngbya boryana CZ1]|uniref:S8 family peptidase n=1 Tax=Leptolyngbya boryana CZ1 TaxID=3060204 RepID=A0AA97ARC3_LEPBY|nr:S8 family peptidase [Leptolyngbya boryana]WNZ44065.1 S8 family peptidase [Leptolyngbya boryana CZ1]
MFNNFRNASSGFESASLNDFGLSNADVFDSSASAFQQISRSPFTSQSEILAASRGSLDRSDDINPTRWRTYKDDYLLRSSTGGQFRINMNSSEFDTYLQIIDFATGRVLTFNDDSGGSTNSQITLSIERNKNYIVRATSFAAYATGTYRINAEQTTNPPGGGGEFNRTYGYGLVDAASAVAQAISQSRFANVPDLGGVNWGNDMVNAPEVWARNFTGQGITVAVIDSGVDITHPDLRDNVWVNQREIANDGIDNDGNGYVDDLYGWNFGVGQFNNNVMPGTSDSGQSHGTHVAGTIAALNNGTGITGVAPNAQIMTLRLGDVSGNEFRNPGSLAQAIRYAVDNGARVINMSLGWSESPELTDAMAYAASRNVITVSAAGNSSRPAPGSPASYATQWGVSVGAVDRNRAIADFSNRAGSDNRLQHVVAPGVNIYSTIPDGQFRSSNGTSMAAPHVAGVVALMLSANPNLTHDQVRRILTGSTSKLSSIESSFVAKNFDDIPQSQPVLYPEMEIESDSWIDSLPWTNVQSPWETPSPFPSLAVEISTEQPFQPLEPDLPLTLSTSNFALANWSDFSSVLRQESSSFEQQEWSDRKILADELVEL